MLEINKIYNINCINGLNQLNDNSVQLTVTSPPYDNLRTYGNVTDWNFDVFKTIANELYRVTQDGGVVVWIVGDATINGSETGSSFKQALYFMEVGFKLHDTMIYEKNSSAFPAKRGSKRYTQIFTKGKIRNDINLLCDKPNKWAGYTNWGKNTQYNKNGELRQTTNIKPITEFSMRNNIWKYSVGFNGKTGHPAVFPQQLATDHILSWSNEGDLVLDPFIGSGTTALSAIRTNRNFIGFEINEDYFNVANDRIQKEIES